jgi:hypothetical protein
LGAARQERGVTLGGLRFNHPAAGFERLHPGFIEELRVIEKPLVFDGVAVIAEAVSTV